MMNETIHDRIKKFAQETLGCACPEEVFQHIEYQHNVDLNNDISLSMKMNIGNRLLIYLFSVHDTDFIIRNLLTLVALGKEERDKRGFNRFRLVLVADNASESQTIAEKTFEGLKDKDDKIHLHVVDKQELEILRMND